MGEQDGLSAEGAARWAPSAGIFAPTTGLDPVLFSGTRLRPEVRRDIMERLDRSLRVDYQVAGSDWQQWIRVYLAGGSASEWAGNRPNDTAQDLDVLLGVDYRQARLHSNEFDGLDDAGIDAKINTGLRKVFNDPDWRPAFGGTWALTGYVNHAAWDIRAIKPYAAYDVTDMKWAVKPPHLPGHSLSDFEPAVLAEARAVLAEARAILREPEPYRTPQAVALWERIHSDRSRAFSDRGEGWLDPGNVIEKWISYAHGDVMGKLRAIVFAHHGNIYPGNINREDENLHPVRPGEARGQGPLLLGTSRPEGRHQRLLAESMQEMSQPAADGQDASVQDRRHAAHLREVRSAGNQGDLHRELLPRLHQGQAGRGYDANDGAQRRGVQVHAQHLPEEDLRHHHRGIRGDAGRPGRQVRDLPGDGGSVRPVQPVRGSQPRDGQATEAALRRLQLPGEEPRGRSGAVRADRGLYPGTPGAGSGVMAAREGDTRCVDCRTIVSHAKWAPGKQYEHYIVHQPLWEQAGSPKGYLCIGCLEKRLGRELNKHDFPADVPVNSLGPENDRYAWSDRTPLLRDRLTREAKRLPSMTKKEAGYRPDGGTPKRRCGTCTMITGLIAPDFESGHCTLVRGLVDAEHGVCREFEPAKRKTAVTGYDGLTSRSAMIYLAIPEGAVEPEPGGVDDDDGQHITVVYLGKNVSNEAFEEASRRAQEAAAQHHQMAGLLHGIETFPPSESSDGKTPVFVPAYIPGIGALRRRLEDLNASQHTQYRPHMTLAYLEPGDSMPAPRPPVRVRFTHLHIKRGDEVRSFPLGKSSLDNTAFLAKTRGMSVTAAEDNEEAEAVLRALGAPAPDIGQHFKKTDRFGGEHDYSVTGWMRRRHFTPEQRKWSQEYGIEPQGHGPDNVPLEHCHRHQAEYVIGTGVAGTIARLNQIHHVEPSRWPADRIEHQREMARLTAGEPVW